MVKIGFIVEGETEKIIIESEQFKSWAHDQGLEVCHPVINAGGSGNLLPQHLGNLVSTLKKHAAPQHIIIITDLEHEPSTNAVRQRIGNEFTNLIFIAIKAIEAWFLADSCALQKWLKLEQPYHEPSPEETIKLPWDRLKALAEEKQQRGPGASKPGFAKRMVTHYDFSIDSAAQHPNCPSVKEFHQGLLDLATGQP